MTNAFACDLVLFIKIYSGFMNCMIDGCKLFTKPDEGFVDENEEFSGMFLCKKCREKYL